MKINKQVILMIYMVSIIILYSCNFFCDKQANTHNNLNKSLDSYKLLDSILPDLKPRIFAKDIISLGDRFEQYCSFSSDGHEFFFSYTDSAWGKSTSVKVDILDSLKQEYLNLVNSDYQSGYFMDITGNKLYFTAMMFSKGIWNADIFVAERTDEGWKNAKRLGDLVNSRLCEWHPTLTNSGVMYFASEKNYDHGIADIYKAIPKGKKFKSVEKLSSIINSEYNETDPLIAPDESFLIFASSRPNIETENDTIIKHYDLKQEDLYISFYKDGTWTSPKYMKGINTKCWEFAPALSPDRKFLFFTRRKAFKTLEPSKIYWVDAKIIEQYKY